MLLYIPYAGWPLVMQMENGDDVIPSWFLEQLRTSFFYDGKYARVVANVEWRLPSQQPAAGPAPGPGI